MITPPATLGLLGGGQLGRFFVLAAQEMGYKVWVLDPDSSSPAGRIADRHLCQEFDDFAALDELRSRCAAITTEFENVPAISLGYLGQTHPTHPSAGAVAICQNRVAEKSFLRDNNIPHADFFVITSEEDLRSAPAHLYPGILKVARFGYDGKGQARVTSPEQALGAFGAFKGEICVLEEMLPLDYEASVVLTRDESGRVKSFEAVENIHENGILDISIAPARCGASISADMQEIAQHLAHELCYVGTLGVEFFVSRGKIYVNEIAPRPHNSGHYTLDACITSQYEQQVRALCGLPLNESRTHSAAVMVNLLGDIWFDEHDEEREPDWEALLRFPSLKLHLYGKHHARKGRKMGHFTVVDADPAKAYEIAMQARKLIGIGVKYGK